MRRAVRTVICLIAAGFIVVGGMNVGLEYVRHRLQDTEVSSWRICLGLVGVTLGLALFVTSRSLAEKMTDDIDE